MPRNEDRKYTQTVEYIEDLLGGDVDRDLIRVAIAAQDNESINVSTSSQELLEINLAEVSGVTQTGADIPDILDDIRTLTTALEDNATDQLRVVVHGEDKAGNLRAQTVQSLGSNIGKTEEGAVTFLARALNSVSEDQVVVRVEDTEGNRLDLLTDSVTESVDGDEVRATQYLEKPDGTIERAKTADLGTNLDATFFGLITHLSRALESSGVGDEVRTAGYLEEPDGTLQQQQTRQLGTGVSGTDFGLLTHLSAALESAGIDSIRSDPYNNNEADFGVHTDTIPSGRNWAVETDENLHIDDFTISGDFWLDGTTFSYGIINGDGTIHGDGTIINRA